MFHLEQPHYIDHNYIENEVNPVYSQYEIPPVPIHHNHLQHQNYLQQNFVLAKLKDDSKTEDEISDIPNTIVNTEDDSNLVEEEKSSGFKSKPTASEGENLDPSNNIDISKTVNKKDRQKYAKSLWSFPSLPKYIVSPFSAIMDEDQKVPEAPNHQYSRSAKIL